MKRLLTIVLTVALVLSFGLQTVAFAAEDEVQALTAEEMTEALPLEEPEEQQEEDLPPLEQVEEPKQLEEELAEPLEQADDEWADAALAPELGQADSTISGQISGLFPQLAQPMAVPGTPSNFSAVSLSNKEVLLSWDAVAGAERYYIVRWETHQSPSSRVVVGYSRSTSAVDDSITGGKEYYYAAVARSSIGEYGDYSYAVYAAPVRVGTPNVKVSLRSWNSLRISWSRAGGAYDYALFRSTSRNQEGKIIYNTARGGPNHYIDTGLKTGQTYYYRVVGYRYRDPNNPSTDGLTIGATHQVRSRNPVVQRPDRLGAKSYSGGRIRLTWGRTTGAHGYYVYRSTSKNGRYTSIRAMEGTTSTAFTNRNLRAGQTYYYKVVPYRNVDGVRVRGLSSAPIGARAR